MKKIFFFLPFIIFAIVASSQNINLYPTNWWVGMKWNKVQLLVRAADQNISNEKVSVNYPGITLKKVSKFANSHYLALDITIAANTKPGIAKVKVGNETINFPLQKEEQVMAPNLPTELLLLTSFTSSCPTGLAMATPQTTGLQE